MKNKQNALRSITHRQRNGQDIYEVYIGVDVTGKQIRLSRNSAAELRDEINRFYGTYRAVGPCAAELNAHQVFDAVSAFELLRGAGIKDSLTSIVSRFIERHGGAIERVRIGDALEKYIASFADPHSAHVKTIRSRVGGWVKWCGENKMMDTVGRDNLEKFLNERFAKSAKTWNNVLSYCKSFFRWCKSERVGIADSALESIPQRQVEYKEPEFIGVGGLEKTLRAMEAKGDREAIAYMTLSFFCGIRAEEIRRLTDSAGTDIRIEDALVRISRPKGYTKGIRPRAVQLLPNARAWLAVDGVADAVLGMDVDAARTRAKAAAHALGVEWPNNAGRHSFITYHVAAFGEPAKTEAIVGTSSAMRVNHYMGLASKADGERYFSIMPKQMT